MPFMREGGFRVVPATLIAVVLIAVIAIVILYKLWAVTGH